MADSVSTTTFPTFTLWLSVAGVGGTLLGAALAPLVNFWVNERQMDVKMVEIGIGILRAAPTEDVTVIRSWAIDVIERSSGRKFTDVQRAALLKQELPYTNDFQPYPSIYSEKPVKDRFPLTPKK